jgi:hypothetical protein
MAVLASCSDNYPDIKPKLVDWNRQRFLNHDMVDARKLQFEARDFDADLSKLNAHYCITAKEADLLLVWGREQIEKKGRRK